MTCIETTLQARRALGVRQRNYLRLIATFFQSAWRQYWMRRAQRATVLILQSLDDRTLRDIGISPTEIESCVYGEVPDRRRPYNLPSARLHPDSIMQPAAGAASHHGS